MKCLGDGMLLAFGDVRAAVSAAFAIQHAAKRQNFGVPPERQMLLRMGIEISDVIIECRDVYGHGVNSPLGWRASPVRARSWSRRGCATRSRRFSTPTSRISAIASSSTSSSRCAHTASARPARVR